MDENLQVTFWSGALTISIQKFLLTDPKTRNARGFLLTANLTPEALIRNPEIAIELNSDEAQDLFRQFLIGNQLKRTEALSNPFFRVFQFSCRHQRLEASNWESACRTNPLYD